MTKNNTIFFVVKFDNSQKNAKKTLPANFERRPIPETEKDFIDLLNDLGLRMYQKILKQSPNIGQYNNHWFK
jgi:hypothetical protein